MSETMMKTPALAVVGPDGRIVRSTETFRRRYEGAEKMCERSPELERVLTGHADVATLTLGEMSVEIEAVTDAAGRRRAMLTLPSAESTPPVEPPVSALREAAEESPAIVWVKDLDGRYLFANPRYLADFGTSEERLLGNTDAELPELETADGPRLRQLEDGREEPLQLEYTVPAVDHRPALAAFRFALRDERGKPVATCGVAAPASEAQVARRETVRLMQLERWNRLDPVEVRAELLEQWHVQAAPPRPAEPEVDEAPSAAVAEEAEAATAPPLDRAEALQGELLQAQARMRQAESDTRRALEAVARATEEADRWRTELEQNRLELERALARLTDFESALDRSPAAPARSLITP